MADRRTLRTGNLAAECSLLLVVDADAPAPSVERHQTFFARCLGLWPGNWGADQATEHSPGRRSAPPCPPHAGGGTLPRSSPAPFFGHGRGSAARGPLVRAGCTQVVVGWMEARLRPPDGSLNRGLPATAGCCRCYKMGSRHGDKQVVSNGCVRSASVWSRLKWSFRMDGPCRPSCVPGPSFPHQELLTRFGPASPQRFAEGDLRTRIRWFVDNIPTGRYNNGGKPSHPAAQARCPPMYAALRAHPRARIRGKLEDELCARAVRPAGLFHHFKSKMPRGMAAAAASVEVTE